MVDDVFWKNYVCQQQCPGLQNVESNCRAEFLKAVEPYRVVNKPWMGVRSYDTLIKSAPPEIAHMGVNVQVVKAPKISLKVRCFKYH